MSQGSRLRAWSGSGFAAALMLAAPAVLAQVAFDVAPIKESQSLEAGGGMRLLPDGGVRARNLAVRGLITIAYQLQQYQLVNAPGWASEARYNIEAKPGAKVSRAHCSRASRHMGERWARIACGSRRAA